MQSLIVLGVVCLVSLALGMPAPQGEVLIIRSESELHGGDGTYRYAWEDSAGTQVEESGYLKPNGNDDPIQVAQGSYQYFSPEGEFIRVEYVADENGFQPVGAHLPTPPSASSSGGYSGGKKGSDKKNG